MSVRLSHNDEQCFREMLKASDGTGRFTASLASLAGLIGEIDHLRGEQPEPETPPEPCPLCEGAGCDLCEGAA